MMKDGDVLNQEQNQQPDVIREDQKLLPTLNPTCIQKLDMLDQKFSTAIHLLSLPAFEGVLLIFGFLFNRGLCVLSFGVSAVYAYYYPESLKLPANMIKKAIQIYVLFNVVQLVTLFLVTQTLKKVIRRRRPVYATEHHGLAPFSPKRFVELSHKEVGTLAMPSGDSAQGALWCALTLFFFDSPWYICTVLPLVALSRVYFRCHWLGDTLVGSVIGIGWAFLGFKLFPFFTAQLALYFPNQFTTPL